MRFPSLRLLGLFVVAAMLIAGPAAAQRPPHSGGGGARVAAPSGGRGHVQAVPRGSRPRGDRPTIGTAAPRGTIYPQNYRPFYPGSYRYPGFYRSYYYNPFYYGSFGLGFYYNPFWWGFGFGAPWYGYGPYGWYGGGPYGWYGGGPYGWYGYGPYGGYGYGGYGRYGSADYATGEIQLKVKPKEAQVYVDGYFVGSVEDFDGWGKRLTVKAAPDPGQTHRIETRYPGYETLSFEISMTPGQSITYRGEMKKVQPEQQPIR